MIKNIIFDWSGVISDDYICGYQAAMNIFKKLGIKTHSIDEHEKHFTLPYMNFYKKFTDLPKKEIDKMFEEEIHKVDEPCLLLKVKETLDFLHKKDIKMVVLSSHPEKKLKMEAKDYKLHKHFINIYARVHDKTEEIEKVMKENNFDKRETAYVGDMTHDIEAGQKAGVKTIAIPSRYESKAKLKKANPDFIIDKIMDIKKLL
jgi:phosphoglycolate phosphatase